MAIKWNSAKVAAELKGRLVENVRDAAEFLADTARDQCPVKTGRLRDSIEVDIHGDGLSATVSATAPYSAAVEHGTHKTSANPFMRRAMAMAADYLRRKLRAN
jgi:HK97 gp10 family phage protein